MRPVIEKLQALIELGKGVEEAQPHVQALHEAIGEIESLEAAVEGWKDFLAEEDLDKHRLIDAAIKWTFAPSDHEMETVNIELENAVETYLGVDNLVNTPHQTWAQIKQYIKEQTGYVVEQEDVQTAGGEGEGVAAAVQKDAD